MQKLRASWLEEDISSDSDEEAPRPKSKAKAKAKSKAKANAKEPKAKPGPKPSQAKQRKSASKSAKAGEGPMTTEEKEPQEDMSAPATEDSRRPKDAATPPSAASPEEARPKRRRAQRADPKVPKRKRGKTPDGEEENGAKLPKQGAAAKNLSQERKADQLLLVRQAAAGSFPELMPPDDIDNRVTWVVSAPEIIRKKLKKEVDGNGGVTLSWSKFGLTCAWKWARILAGWDKFD